MDNNNKISFIPKKPLVSSDFSGKQPLSLRLMLSFSIFFITCAVYGGSYIYAQTLEKEIDVKKKELQDLKNKFDLSIIERARDLKARIKSAHGIIDNHMALSTFFDFLEQETFKSIGYSSLQYLNNEGKLEVTLIGMAPNYASIILQRDGFMSETRNGGRLLSFSIGDYKLEETGNVSFSIKASLNPSSFLYKNDFRAITQEPGLTSEDNSQIPSDVERVEEN